MQGTPLSRESIIACMDLPDVWLALLIEGHVILGSYFVFKSKHDLPTSSGR